MLRKVHNKGQVVIPAAMREELGISTGDHLDVRFDAAQKCIELRKSTAGGSAGDLAGSLREYGRGKPFPSRDEAKQILQRGLSRDA